MTVRQFIASLRESKGSFVSKDIKELRLAFIMRYDGASPSRDKWLEYYNVFLDGWQAACRRHKIPFHFSGKG